MQCYIKNSKFESCKLIICSGNTVKSSFYVNFFSVQQISIGKSLILT